jgi:hypothetical protein
MNQLTQWVIYFNPSDQPGKYVARKWLIGPGYLRPTHVSYTSDTLEDARQHIPEWMCNLGRLNTDDTAIVEVWT